MKNRLSNNNEQAEPQQPLPYERKVLLECPVAGAGFHDINNIWDELYIGAKIALVREQGNKYDKNAVAVALANDYDDDPENFDFNFILGYIPRTLNNAIAVMLDMGHEDILEAEITELNEHAPYSDRVHITVYVRSKEPIPPSDNRLRLKTFEEEEEWNTFTDEIWQKGVSLFRWGGFPPWELDLPKKGDMVVFMYKRAETTALYLMTVIAKDDDCAPYVDDIENLYMLDDCSPYALTVVKGPVSVRNEKLDFMCAALGRSWQPDFKLEMGVSDSLMDIINR